MKEVYGINLSDTLSEEDVAIYARWEASTQKGKQSNEVCSYYDVYIAFCSCGKYWANPLEEDRVYLACRLQSILEGSQGGDSSRNLEAGPAAETMEDRFLEATL